jgi:monoamine oxidase
MGRELTRRRFIGVAGGTVAALGTGVAFSRCGGESKARRDVVVVGAGLAGLTAAFELEERGRDVVVLEARNRVGGRVHTIRDPFTGGQHAEAGGEYVDGNHLNLLAFVRRFGLRLERVGRGIGNLRDQVVYDGALSFRDEFVTAEAQGDLARFNSAVLRLGRSVDPADPVATDPGLDRRDVESLIEELAPSPRGRFLIDTYLRDFYATTAADLSLLYLATQERIYRDVPGAQIEFARIRGGNDALTGAFAERLADLRLSAPVTRIETGDDTVVVGAGDEELEADHAILALPLPALAAVDFEPDPPPALAAAFGGVTYGRVTKNLVQSDRRTWREQGSTGYLVSDLPLGATWEATDQQPGRAGILIDYAGGEESQYFETRDVESRESYVNTHLARAYPGLQPTAFASVSWPTEPYTGGSWIAPRPGELTEHWDALRSSHGRLFLAGEHTSVMSGYMESAIRSGRRAAAQVQAAAG